MKLYRISLLMLMMLVVVSCKSSKKSAEVVVTPVANEQSLTSLQSVTTDPSVSDDSQNEKLLSMDQSMIDFAFRFYTFQSGIYQNKNFCVSPVSLQIALGMTYPGARNVTAEQMSKTLGFSADMDAFLKDMGGYYRQLKKSEKDTAFEFAIANRIYVEKTYKLLEPYRLSMNQFFDGAFEEVDFINLASEAEKKINMWVEDQTRKRITQLIPDGLLDSSTLMVLVNAIYFKSAWRNPFEESQSKELPFWAGERGKIDVKYMTGKKEGLKYVKYKQWQVLEIPYVTHDFSFIIILPEKSTGTDLHKHIPTAEEYVEMLKNMRYEDVYAEIPMFKMESSFSLEAMMSNMGMPIAFTNSADFSGMSGHKDIKISKILQKVFIEVNEKGSEAAAATAVIMVRTTSVAPTPKDPVRFIAKHPFIFILKENNTHTPLFIGQYVGESEK